MPSTRICPLIGTEDEHNIVVMLTNSSIEKIVFIQDQLKQILGDAIWLTPPNVLHITLMEVVCNTTHMNMSRSQYFLDWHKKYNQITKNIIANYASFCTNFNQLLVSPDAIILKSSNPTPFNNLRNTLLSKVKLPEGTKMPPKIAHTTIARFNKAIDLKTVINQTRLVEVNYTECIKKFTLLKDLKPPDFNPKVIETYYLDS